MSYPDASDKQKRYIMGLGEKLHQEYTMEELQGINTHDANEMIRKLKQALYGDVEDPSEKMRRKLISMAKTIGWLKPGNVADMDRVNNWCKSYGQYHKPLNDHSYKELTHLVTQFQHGPFKSKYQKSRV